MWKDQLEGFSKKLFKWIPNNAYGYSHVLHCALFTAHIFLRQLYMHERTHVQKNTSGFPGNRKIAVSPQRPWGPMFLLFCILKKDLIPCDISRFEGFFIVQVFNIHRRSPFRWGFWVFGEREQTEKNPAIFHSFIFFSLPWKGST